MADFHFLRPFWLTALIPVFIVWWWILRHRDPISALRQVVDTHLLEHLVVDDDARQRFRPAHVLLAIWTLTSMALAGPTWKKEVSPFAEDEAGLMVLMKVGGTMKATDVQPSRLERAKHKLRDILKLRAGSPAGLIVYSGSAHLVMPLTTDHRIIGAMAQEISPELMPAEGDALVPALQLAVSVFERSGVPGSILVMADSVSPAQAEAVSQLETDPAVQFLLLQPFTAPVDSDLNRAADGLDAPVTRLSADSTDVELLERGARSRIRAVAPEISGDRWRDDGYALLPLIALLSLMWSRKGWGAI